MPRRPLPFVILAVLLVVPGWTGPTRLPLWGSHPRVTAARVALDPADPARRRLGRLTYLGGVALRSADPAFGGYSALAVRGDRLLLVSDGGNILRFRLRSDGQIAGTAFAALPAGPGTGWEKRDRDSEALAIDPATGAAWVAFEQENAIWRYAPGIGGGERVARPPAMRRWRDNGGAETLVRRRDGRFVVIAEIGARRGERDRAALLFGGDPTAVGTRASAFRYRPTAGYDPVDAAELPDGRLLVLGRRWQRPMRFSSVLEVVDRKAIRAGAIVRGRPIAQLDAPTLHDNFEGVAVSVERGRTIVWLVSDDNQSPLQRTLLLKFRFD